MSLSRVFWWPSGHHFPCSVQRYTFFCIKHQNVTKKFIHGAHGGHGSSEKNYSILPCKSLTRIFHFIFLSWFLFRFTIGYFSRDSAKNKFLDLFSALTAPKIRASTMRSIFKSSPEARYSSVFSVKVFVLDFPPHHNLKTKSWLEYATVRCSIEAFYYGSPTARNLK